jgi:hypothetical protein
MEDEEREKQVCILTEIFSLYAWLGTRNSGWVQGTFDLLYVFIPSVKE